MRSFMPDWLEKYWRFALLTSLAPLAFACQAEIGAACQVSRDCSAAGDRLCDITAPGGYCTIFNCEPGTCPEDESLCVQFGASRSRLPGCEDAQSPSPHARSFCMASCERDSDCRPSYVCADLGAPNNPWNALLIDSGRGGRACVVPALEPVPATHDTEVCQARDAVTEAAESSAQGGSATE
jgi:hypothetical protein